MAVNEARDVESLRRALAREAAEHAETLTAMRDKLHLTQERLDRQCESRNRLREQLETERKRSDRLIAGYRRRLAARRQLPLEDLVAQLPMRARAPRLLQDDRATASAREQRFMGTSVQYAAAVEAAQRADDAAAGRVTIEGLAWWVPRDERMPERLERAEGQGFPLRAILQTRQVALGGVMLDLGGNIGRTSVTRVLLGDVRVVYAAEPEPANYGCLVRNVVEHGLRGFVLPDNVAIGAVRGEVLLRRSRFIGGHRVLQPGQADPEETLTVPSWPVDEWLAHHGVDVDAVAFVKVDVQGQETNILRGAERLLSRPGVNWQIELDPKLLKAAGTSLAELCQLLARHFTHFIDLSKGASGPIRSLVESIAYVGGDDQHKTDVLVYRAESSAS